ncbi:transmembrane protein 71 [Pluvialis apricaria]
MDMIRKITVKFPPANAKEMQAFLGIVGFWRLHILGHSQLMSPLYQVTQKKNYFKLGPKQQHDGQEVACEVALGPIQTGPVSEERYLSVRSCQLFEPSVDMITTPSYLAFASAGSAASHEEHRRSLSQRIFPSYAYAFLDANPAYECCSANLLTGSPSTCRRSPRLLSNGYYVLTEDSFLSDEEGNITLTPSHTSVTYKENLVRVFRRRKKIRRSLASLFDLDASGSWLSSTVLSNMDSSHVDDPWPDGCNKLEASQSDIGDSDFSSAYDSHVAQRQIPASNGASLTKDDEFLHPDKPFCASKSCSPFMINANEEALSNEESRIVRNVLSQMVALITCLVISICTRYFLGGLSATLLLIILVFLLSQEAAVSSFFSLDTSFKTTKFWK